MPFPPAPDQRQALFRYGLAAVRRLTGWPERRARSMLGKWLKVLGDDCAILNKILLEALERKPAEPVAWIEAAVNSRCPPAASAWPDAGDRTGWVTWVERGGDSRASVIPDLDGEPRAELGGTFLDWATGEICDAAGGLRVDGVDWRPLLQWLADGIDAHDTILPVIRDVARRAPSPVGNLAYFDRAIRQASGLARGLA